MYLVKLVLALCLSFHSYASVFIPPGPIECPKVDNGRLMKRDGVTRCWVMAGKEKLELECRLEYIILPISGDNPSKSGPVVVGGEYRCVSTGAVVK